jgi:hypothetical protein
LKNEEVPAYLQQTGSLLVALLSELEGEAEASEARVMVARVLGEQYQIEEDETITLR